MTMEVTKDTLLYAKFLTNDARAWFIIKYIMNQPIKVYQNNQPNIDIGTKTPNITLSPAMKRRLKPIPDNQGLIQLT